MVAACIEQCHDENGIIWPAAIAPWDLIIIPLNMSKEDIKSAAESLYAEAQKAGIRVLLDDREDSAGVKLKDADLIGVPFAPGSRRTKNGRKKESREFRRRSEKTSEDLPLDSALKRVQEFAPKSALNLPILERGPSGPVFIAFPPIFTFFINPLKLSSSGKFKLLKNAQFDSSNRCSLPGLVPGYYISS